MKQLYKHYSCLRMPRSFSMRGLVGTAVSVTRSGRDLFICLSTCFGPTLVRTSRGSGVQAEAQGHINIKTLAGLVKGPDASSYQNICPLSSHCRGSLPIPKPYPRVRYHASITEVVSSRPRTSMKGTSDIL